MPAEPIGTRSPASGWILLTIVAVVFVALFGTCFAAL